MIKMVFNICMTILQIVRSQYDYSYCAYYESNYYNFPQTYGEVQTSNNNFDLNSQLKFGIGFWMSYRPLKSADSIKNPEAIDSNNLKQVFVYAFQHLDIYSILFYVDISLDPYGITHNMLFLTKNGLKLIFQEMDYTNYEGDWIFAYFFIDLEEINVIFFSASLNNRFTQKIQQSLQLYKRMESVTGGYQNAKNYKNENLHLQVFPGMIQPVILNFGNSFFDDFDEFILNCWPYNQCNIHPYNLIPFNLTLTDQIIINSTSLFKMSYTLSGWIKLNPLGLYTSSSSVLLRITPNQFYQDNNQIGDRLLYIMYYQNSLDLQQNGFTLQTYSYTFPWRPNTYISDSSDTIYVLGQEYKDLIIQWHYFQYEFGTQTNNGQPTYTVYFTGINTIKQYKWQKQIKHFTTQTLYFSIGGDDYYPTIFQGQLSDWVFNLLCDVVNVNFQPNCHYSCDKCKGITKYDCISCTEQSLRVYSEQQNTCKCKFGYIDAPLKTNCLQLNEYSPIFNLQEQEIIIKEKGYYNLDNIICEVGYFKYKNTCIECPYFPQTNLIQCADCYLYPANFSQTLRCTLKLESSDESTVLFYIKLNEQEYEQFSIKLLSNQKYTLKSMKGHIFKHTCKSGYFLSEIKECQECPSNCAECVNEFTCDACDSRYAFDTNGNCVFCENCVERMKFILYNGQDPVELIKCQQGQYQTTQNLCLNCGYFCKICSEYECYYCEDQSKYFLTLDLFNCAECLIDNCKYCFQYAFSEEQGIITSLDESIQSNLQFSEIKTACALCDDGYFFSFATMKCESRPQNMADCETGIITDMQQSICLISKTRIDAIQQSICEVENCLSCINNYSPTISQLCVICKDGYYSSLLNGQCKKCPSNCLTCAQYYSGQYNSWKNDIRVFYHFFINSKKDHYFEDHQSQYLVVACINCSPNFYLTSDLICKHLCSDDCLDCQIYFQISGIYFGEKFKCNKCKPALLNQQRSVAPDSLNQCLSCPDYCSACYPRSTNEITELNPFFNLESQYFKYSYICYSNDNNKQFENVYSLPKYLVPNICEDYKVCEKTIQISLKLYCDLMSWYSNRNNEQDIIFQDIQRFDVLSDIMTQEILDYMNQVRVTKIIYQFEMIKEPQDKECFVATGLNFTNNWNQDVFTLSQVSIAFWKSSRSQQENIPFLLYSGFSIINYYEIYFNNIQFITNAESFYSQQNPTANISFINQYSPITLIFLKCEIISQYWDLFTSLTFTSDRIQKLAIDQLYLKDLMIQDCKIFDLQPRKEYTNTSHTISELVVKNSSFINSTLFYYNADQFSLNQIMNFQNVTILDSNFSKSYFINSSFFADFNIGELYLDDFHLENLILTNNSILFQVSNGIKFNVNNFTIQNIKLEDQSSLFICNIISAYNLLILNSFIDSGYFMNVQQQSFIKRSYQITNEISFSRVSYVNNIYSSSHSLIRILQDELTKVNFSCTDLLLDNNNFISIILGKQQFKYVSYKQSLVYIDCTTCQLQNIQIIRGIGLPEISIVNSQSLQINNFHLESNKQYFQRYLHSSIECARQYIYLDIPFAFYIWSYQNVKLDNITIQDTIVADYPLIIFLGKSQTEQIWSETIHLTNSIFQNNLLFIINENRQSSIIFVETKQSSDISIKNVSFNHNFLNIYKQNNLDHSSTTLIINAQQGNIKLESSLFESNIITNSSDAMMHIQAKLMIISDCSFQNQNILTDVLFQKNLISLKQSNLLNINIDFPILSQGGNGYIEVSSLNINNTNLFNSLARNGGGFYIVTLNDGIIWIHNCSFYNTSTLLNGNYISSGGLFYIDSSQGCLNFTISQCQINSSYSRTFGGAIFIEPSKSKNNIYFDRLKINSVFSIQHSFLSYSPNKLIAVSSFIILSNIQFQNNEAEFEKYASKLTGLSSQNILLFQNQNPIFYILFSKVSIMNCSFMDIHLANIIEIDQATSINIQQLNIFNSTIFQSPIIKLSLGTEQGTILLRNVMLSNLIEFPLSNQKTCVSIGSVYTKLVCPSVYSDISDKLTIEVFQTDFQLQCNLNQLYSIISKQNFSIIQLINFNQDHFIFLDNIETSFIKCLTCVYGIVAVQAFDKYLHFQMVNLKVHNNDCGELGCLSIIQSVNDIDWLQSSNISYNSNDNDIKFNTTLTSSKFINNTAHYGGACFFSEIAILINSCIFSNNSAVNSGGSIYYISQNTTLLIINTSIVNNHANVGGGVFLKQQQLERFDELNLIVDDNNADEYANNLYEAPRFLYLSLDNANRQNNIEKFANSSTIIEQVQISPYLPFNSKSLTDVLLLPSGISVSEYKFFNPEKNTYIPFNISLRLQATNIFGEKMENLENTECQIHANIKNKYNTSLDQLQTNNSSNNQFLSYSKVNFNMDTQDYNLDDLIIFFNPNQDESIQLQLAFICNSIQIPFYNSTSTEPDNIIKNYILLLNIKTFQCQLGEYFNQTTGGCVLCDVSQGQFSVTINSSSCSYKDETKISEIEPAIIKLRENYWRAYYYSEIIEICHNLLANCQGGWYAGNPSCSTGHIGALCEQCDLYNIKGEGSFSQNRAYQCSSCSQSGENILNIVFIILWTFLSVLITVTSTIYMIESFVFQLKLKPLGFFSVFKSASTSILLKVFTNYLQIVSSITSFQLSVPIFIQLAVRGVGNPIGSMAFSLDCYLKSLTHIPMIYFRIIWGFAMAGMYILLFFLIHILLSACKKQKVNITFITTTFIYIFIYLSPNQVSDLSLLISNRNISGQQWIAANVAYLYNTQVHGDWLLYFVIPTFLMISVLLPFLFWYILYHHRQHLNQTKTRRIWGYLYNEYKLSTYYWETIKIIQKELIIIILIYYEDFVVIKACLIFFLLFLYGKLTQKFKPYLTEDLNQIDSFSTSICKISIVLAQSIYSAQNLGKTEIVWPFYIVLAAINCYFIVKMIIKILFAYFDNLYEQIDKIKALLFQNIPSNLRKSKVCLRLLRNRSERKQIIRLRYQQVRIYLINQAKQIINFKRQMNSIFRQNNMNLLSPQNYCKRSTFEDRKASTIFKNTTTSKLIGPDFF